VRIGQAYRQPMRREARRNSRVKRPTLSAARRGPSADTLYAAELNVVLARRRRTHNLLVPPTVLADEATLTAVAKVDERHDTEQVEVKFKRG